MNILIMTCHDLNELTLQICVIFLRPFGNRNPLTHKQRQRQQTNIENTTYQNNRMTKQIKSRSKFIHLVSPHCHFIRSIRYGKVNISNDISLKIEEKEMQREEILRIGTPITLLPRPGSSQNKIDF